MASNLDFIYSALLSRSRRSRIHDRRVSTLNALEPIRLELPRDALPLDDFVGSLGGLDWDLERGIQESQSVPEVKKLLSDKGKTALKSVRWSKGMDVSCVITCDDFAEGQTVTQLPCKHCFQPAAIAKWVTENDASCPVCRASLPHKEVSSLPDSPTHPPSDHQPGWIGVTTFSFEISY